MTQQKEDDLYSFDDDQRKAFFDLQSIIKARELNHFSSSDHQNQVTPNSSSQRTTRPRQQFSEDSAAPSSSDNYDSGSVNGLSSRSSSFPPLAGQTSATSSSSSNGFTTRDVRSGLLGAEDDEPSFADFYDVGDFGHDEDEEEYFEDYYGERSCEYYDAITGNYSSIS